MDCKFCDVDYPDELCIMCTEKKSYEVKENVNRDQFGIYVIKDNGAGDSSLPFLLWLHLWPFVSSAHHFGLVPINAS